MRVSKLRRMLYRLAALLGDLQAWASGDPRRIARRYARKWLWRTWFRMWRG